MIPKSNEAEDIARGFLGAPFAALLFSPLWAAVWCSYGYVLSKAWAWHLVALGLPMMTWKQGTVVFVVVGLLRTKSHGVKDDRPAKDRGASLALYFCWPWLALLMAWWLT